MSYAERMENVSVLGAAGKMGSGIVLLTALHMAELRLQPENQGRHFVLHAMDISQQALSGLMGYMRTQVQKEAEKRIVALRKLYESREDLIENGEIVEQYVADTLDIVRPVTSLEPARESKLIFEAVSENPELKVKLFSSINQNNPHAPWFFTNTSSIPIQELGDKAALDGRIVGFHFYNPPAVQKLVELIPGRSTSPELLDFARTLAAKLGKLVVPANDIAGFIGNGHFMRDILQAVAEVTRLATEIAWEEAVYAADRVSRDFLLRPMGIFQLVDYVGLDVCQCILAVMASHIANENLHSPLIDQLVARGVLGGQYADGSQKNGFFQYEKGQPQAVYVPQRNGYRPLAEFQKGCDERIGALPEKGVSWKSIVKKTDAAETLSLFFRKMSAMKTFGAELAMRLGRRSREIGLQLVADRVAQKEEDVNTVLLTGFFHVYGPINPFFSR